MSQSIKYIYSCFANGMTPKRAGYGQPQKQTTLKHRRWLRLRSASSACP